MAPIYDAIHAFDVDVLRRELAAGVSPDLIEDDDDDDGVTPLYLAVLFNRGGAPTKLLEERVACIAALLEAGASVDAESIGGETALHAAVSCRAFRDIIDMLLAANADVNNVNDEGVSVLAEAAREGSAATVAKLISAGARDLHHALVEAVANGSLRNCALLLRAGAALPLEEMTGEVLSYYAPDDPRRHLIMRARAYIAEIFATLGGFKANEREHRRRLTAVFTNKFPALPVEVISHIVLLWAHCGDYDYQDYAAPRAEYWRVMSEQIAREREAAASAASDVGIPGVVAHPALVALLALAHAMTAMPAAEPLRATDGVPEGWVAKTTDDGRPYYANSVTELAQWEFPSCVASDLPPGMRSAGE